MRRFLVILVTGFLGTGCPTSDARECESDRDCFGGEVCVESVCVGLSSGGDVANNGTNGPTDCRVAGGCGAGVCDDETGRCVGCSRNADCGEESTCDKETGKCACRDGFHACDGICRTDDDAAACGESCVECPTDPTGVAACVDSMCEIACEDGRVPCTDGPCNRACVQCNTASDCDASNPVCDDNVCTACESDADCSAFPNEGICEGGSCVRCTEARSGACNGTSCNPATNTCTETPLGQLSDCDECVSDTECPANYGCVAMKFKGADLPNGYCLEKTDAGCSRPFPILVQRPTLSDEQESTFCGIRENTLTCAAFNKFLTTCPNDMDSECSLPGFADGQCRSMGGTTLCTFGCVDDNDCPGGSEFCVNGLYCLDPDR